MLCKKIASISLGMLCLVYFIFGMNFGVLSQKTVFAAEITTKATKILLVQDDLPMNLNSNTNALSNLHIPYDVIRSSVLNDCNLENYTVIMYASAQQNLYYTNIFSNINKITTFVENGGLLIAHCFDRSMTGQVGGWSGIKILPDDVKHLSRTENFNYQTNNIVIRNNLHSIVNGFGVSPSLTDAYLSNWGYSASGIFTDLPLDVDIIMRTNDGDTYDGPAYIDYNVGKGKVLATMMPAEWGYGEYGINKPQLLINELRFAAKWVVYVDTTSPITNCLLEGVSGNLGWYTSDVKVTLNAADETNGSGVNYTEYSLNGVDWVRYVDPFTVTVDGNSTLSYRSVDIKGNIEFAKTSEIKIDKVAPIIMIGAYTTVPTKDDITVTAESSDGNLNTTSYIFTENGSFEFVATDLAGNKSKQTVTITNIDKKLPIISLKDSNPISVILGFTFIDSGATAIDEYDGDITNRIVTKSNVNTNAIGTYTVTYDVTDTAGNNAVQVTRTVNVIYKFTGFFQPVDMGDTVFNIMKAGSAVPVKFSLDGNKGLDIFDIGYPKSTAITISLTGITYEAIETTIDTASNSGLTYDSTTGQYTYVWKTDKTWAGTSRQLIVKFKDGMVYTANFKFSK